MRNLTGGVVWAALTTQRLGSAMPPARAPSSTSPRCMGSCAQPAPVRGHELREPARLLRRQGGSDRPHPLHGVVLERGRRARQRPRAGPFSNTEDLRPNSVAREAFAGRLRERTHPPWPHRPSGGTCGRGRVLGVEHVELRHRPRPRRRWRLDRHPDQGEPVQPVEIAGRPVGPGHHPASPWPRSASTTTATCDIARRLIEAAADCRRRREVPEAHGGRRLRPGQSSPSRARARSGSPTGISSGAWSWTRRLRRASTQHCRVRGIPWFASCWDEAAVDFVARWIRPATRSPRRRSPTTACCATTAAARSSSRPG